MASRRGLVVALALASSVVGRVALAADPTAQEKETARAMMDEGHARRDTGDHKAALAQFEGADALMHVPTTGLEVAREQVSLGLLAEARDTLNRILRKPLPDDAPEAFRVARSSAKALDDDLAKRVPALRIAISGVSSSEPIQVTVDGLRVPAAALVAPFKVNPGHHVVAATTAGGSAREEVDVTEGQTSAVALTVLPTGPSAEPVPSSPDTKASTEEKHPRPIVTWLRWGGFGLAAAGVGLGSVTGAMSIAATSAAKKSCVNDLCPPSSWSDINSAHTTATISTVSFIAAGAGAALGIVSFVVGSSSASSSGAASTGSRVSVWIGAGVAGVAGTL